MAVKFENGAAVDDFDFAEFAGNAIEDLFVQLEIRLVIAAFIVVVIAECARRKSASSAAEQYDFAWLLFSDFTVSVHVFVRLQAPDLSRVRAWPAAARWKLRSQGQWQARKSHFSSPLVLIRKTVMFPGQDGYELPLCNCWGSVPQSRAKR